MSRMKERGERAPKVEVGVAFMQRKRPAGREAREEFVEAFVDALRDILQDERPRAA